MSLRLLLVEDDQELRNTLRDALKIEGYTVLTAASLSEGLALVAHAGKATGELIGIDLIVLDLGLPDGDGEALLVQLRRKHALPVVVISARQAEGQKIRLLDAGADDYLVKPFSIGELLARLRVALRHRGTTVRASLTHYRHANADRLLDVDLTAQTVRRDNTPVHLTPTEFKLLARLVRNAGQVVTHRQLLADVWGAEFRGPHAVPALYMGQLRAKLEPDPTPNRSCCSPSPAWATGWWNPPTTPTPSLCDPL